MTHACCGVLAFILNHVVLRHAVLLSQVESSSRSSSGLKQVMVFQPLQYVMMLWCAVLCCGLSVHV